MTAVSVRRQLAGDVPAVRVVLTDAFGAQGARVADLAETLLAGPARVALVAEGDGEVVGSVMLSRSWIDARRELVEVLVLSPLGVATEHQGAGVGAGLVRAALATAESTPFPLVFLEGDPAYYRRFGFFPAEERGFLRPSIRIPDGAFQVATLPAWQPWMTGAFIYCDAFWQYDSVGLRPAAGEGTSA